MPTQARIVSPGPDRFSVRDGNGHALRPPDDWVLVPPGDPALTRRIKAAGPAWTVQEKKGRKMFSHGVWAPRSAVEAIRRALADERATPEYAKRREAGALRREREQAAYVAEFRDAVVRYLAFNPRYADLAARMAEAITAHATPVGSGTVARTQRIPLQERAEAAVIAWMRHRTTSYDNMTVARVRGRRREVRRMLAEHSRTLLSVYRAGREIDPATCPLHRALFAA